MGIHSSLGVDDPFLLLLGWGGGGMLD